MKGKHDNRKKTKDKKTYTTLAVFPFVAFSLEMGTIAQ